MRLVYSIEDPISFTGVNIQDYDDMFHDKTRSALFGVHELLHLFGPRDLYYLNTLIPPSSLSNFPNSQNRPTIEGYTGNMGEPDLFKHFNNWSTGTFGTKIQSLNNPYRELINRNIDFIREQSGPGTDKSSGNTSNTSDLRHLETINEFMDKMDRKIQFNITGAGDSGVCDVRIGLFDRTFESSSFDLADSPTLMNYANGSFSAITKEQTPVFTSVNPPLPPEYALEQSKTQQ